MHPVLLEDSTHGIVTSDLTSVAGILKTMLANVLPKSLHRLRSR